ncbi:MAG: acylphosphatase [Pseudomonadota bacterium]
MSAESDICCAIKGWVSGRVQGVGFRYFVRQEARRLGIYGYARNLADGRVEFVLQGEKEAVDQLLGHIQTGPTYSKVVAVHTEATAVSNSLSGFGTG